MQSSIFGADRDIWFMQQALKEAHKAYAKDEVPIGAVVVNAEGTIIARGHNCAKERAYVIGIYRTIINVNGGFL